VTILQQTKSSLPVETNGTLSRMQIERNLLTQSNLLVTDTPLQRVAAVGVLGVAGRGYVTHVISGCLPCTCTCLLFQHLL
jgi:hypothetical protein